MLARGSSPREFDTCGNGGQDLRVAVGLHGGKIHSFFGQHLAFDMPATNSGVHLMHHLLDFLLC